MRCIYCLKEKDKSFFNKIEHVIPKSFGSFENNFTLKNIVCDECNQFFGDKIEIGLARDTLEGTYRYDYNIKDPSEFKTAGKRSRLRINVFEGLLKGSYAYRYYSEREGRVLLKPLPQIGLLKRSCSDYEFFLLDKIPHKDSLDYSKYNPDDPKGILILGCELEFANKLLKEKGFNIKIKGEEIPPETPNRDWLCHVEAEVDSTILRAIAKIGFNYLTYWQGDSFVMHKAFNMIRNFILKGEKAAYPLVRVVDTPILGDEPVAGKRRLGHLITVNWAVDKVSIAAQVSLFNWMTYQVCLAREFSGEHIQIKRGNFFDFYNHIILDLGDKPDFDFSNGSF